MHKLTRRDFHGVAIAAGAAAAAGTIHAANVDGPIPWLDEVQRPPESPVSDVPPLADLLVDASGEPIARVDQWEKRRHELREIWQEYLGSLGLSRSPTPTLTVLDEEVIDGVLRQRVEYEIEPEISTEAYLLRPVETRERAHPGAVVFHSTVNHSIYQPAGVEGKPEKAFGFKLAQRGFAVFCPRNFLWPDNSRIVAQPETERFQRRHPGVTGMAKMLYDAQVAVDILASQPSVDSDRIGAVGHSLGAKEVLYLAAFDERIAGTVSSEGGIGTTFSNWDAPWYLGDGIRSGGFKREHHELLAMIAPRPFLLIGGDSADGDRSWPFIAAALPVYRLYTARPALGLLNHRQGHSVPPIAEARTYEWLDAFLRET